MAERNLEQALNRADGLRMIKEFREDYSNVGDQDDIVLLADEVLRLRVVMEMALNRYDREDKGGLKVRDGLTWAMATDLRKGLSDPNFPVREGA